MYLPKITWSVNLLSYLKTPHFKHQVTLIV